MSFYEMVGIRILEILEIRGWKQQDLADKLNISEQVVSKILKGEKNTNINEIKNIAEILDVDINTLLRPVDSTNLFKDQYNSIQPTFIESVGTEIGKEGIKKAVMIVDIINKYEKLSQLSLKNKSKAINFLNLRKKKEYKPSIEFIK